MKNHWAFCADVGSIPNGNFGWASSSDGGLKNGTDIGIFAADIADAIKSEGKVSIGFECPLFVPVRDESRAVASARHGEGQRSWSAGAGTGALATGIVQSLWVMRRIKVILGYAPKPTFDWAEFEKTNSLFLWEAFVASGSKNTTHCQDAEAALRHFMTFAGKSGGVSAIQESSVMSLIGACAIRAGWSKDIELLWKPCLVIKT
ncbi:MAG: hypothetical protein C0392_07375 [Syntrophus sp. (in: bacteria)]|nr:hypothetical protein [Syntrophus sp. (in: bacteria)]